MGSMLRVLKSALVVVCVIAAATAATRAYFAHSKTIAGNEFTAGTVKIGTHAHYHKPVQALNMAPGQEYFGNLIITNDGTLPADFFMRVDNMPGSDPDLFDKLMIRLYYDNIESRLIWEGKLSDLALTTGLGVQLNLGALDPIGVAPNPRSIHLYQKIWFPLDPGADTSSLMDKSVYFDEVFTARQDM